MRKQSSKYQILRQRRGSGARLFDRQNGSKIVCALLRTSKNPTKGILIPKFPMTGYKFYPDGIPFPGVFSFSGGVRRPTRSQTTRTTHAGREGRLVARARTHPSQSASRNDTRAEECLLPDREVFAETKTKTNFDKWRAMEIHAGGYLNPHQTPAAGATDPTLTRVKPAVSARRPPSMDMLITCTEASIRR